MQLKCIRCNYVWGSWQPGEDQTYYSHGVCKTCTIEAIAPKIHRNQNKDGHFPCFATAYDGYCDQCNCCYHSVCVKLYKNDH